MYQNDINLSLAILGLFLSTNVGASLNNNQSTISKEATDNTTTVRTTDYGRPDRKQPSLHGRKFQPNYGELENSFRISKF